MAIGIPTTTTIGIPTYGWVEYTHRYKRDDGDDSNS